MVIFRVKQDPRVREMYLNVMGRFLSVSFRSSHSTNNCTHDN